MSTRDTFYGWYFAIHFVITLMVDGGFAIPAAYKLPGQQFMEDFHVASNKDFIVLEKPAWFMSFIWIEILFQLPFFVYGAYKLLTKTATPTTYLWMLVYGVNASLTTLACLAEVWARAGLTDALRYNLLAVYAPFFFISGYIVIDVFQRLQGELRKVKTD
ncbi:transmembrane protein 6/97 [Yarrowia lipolytica]|nr:transmembrane protein 6/97 [Yarrowia lipolytica]QNP96135.1 Putative membrane protein [Yarrowia lipolytica]RDW25850.1 transmembrane protein 6/97 [Yarrowia lipolytica]RDW31647.1 transmembrane protein 6/97 [Yarrowia lipolytica]RDW36749.1 transmembrane protein 6/97 [Yarrowia lipolytica]